MKVKKNRITVQQLPEAISALNLTSQQLESSSSRYDNNGIYYQICRLLHMNGKKFKNRHLPYVKFQRHKSFFSELLKPKSLCDEIEQDIHSEFSSTSCFHEGSFDNVRDDRIFSKYEDTYKVSPNIDDCENIPEIENKNSEYAYDNAKEKFRFLTYFENKNEGDSNVVMSDNELRHTFLIKNSLSQGITCVFVFKGHRINKNINLSNMLCASKLTVEVINL